MAYRPFDLTGKVAVITGGNGGIGLGMAEALAEAGAAVSVWGRNAERNNAAVARLEAKGVRATGFVCDVADPDAIARACAATLDAHGRIDAAFANAGADTGFTPFVDMTPEDVRRIIDINLNGTFFTFQAAARHMIARGGGGALVATSSLAAIEGRARGEHYAASKGGILSMVKGLAVELARHGIRANSIVPGFVDTPMAGEAINAPKFVERVLPRVPMRRWGKPADFGAIAIYLMSDASAYHTGDMFVIDGGYTLF
jgi:NAD(P)-dependent dehydrogenase (short-subunit alcohol dehydrogenase family)